MLRRVRAWFAPQVDAPAAPNEFSVASETVNDPKLEELGVRLQTVARAQSKLSLRLDELAGSVAANHRELLTQLAGSEHSHSPDEVLDALDRLDDAVRSLEREHGSIAEGLSAIAARLERYVRRSGVTRHAQVGVEPDGRRFRVVGMETRADLPSGVITRVIRSAATRGDELMREGEVLINETRD